MSDFLNPPLGDMSMADLTALVQNMIAQYAPAMPAGVAALKDSQQPVVVPPATQSGQTLIYSASNAGFIPGNPLAPSGVIPPATSAPTITAGIGVLFASWSPVASTDAVTYDVHVSTVSGFTADAGNLYGSTQGSLMTIKTDPTNGNANLVYGTTYYVVVVSRNAVGSAVASAQGSGTPIQAGVQDLAANSVEAGQIAAGSIVSSKLASNIVLSSTIETASTGQRVVVDTNGITLFDPSGNILAQLPTDSTKNPQFSGDLTTTSLTVVGDVTGEGLLLQGAYNQMDQGSELTLSSSFANPSSPGLSSSYPTFLPGGLDLPVETGLTPVTFDWVSYDANGDSSGTIPVYLQEAFYFNSGGTSQQLWLVENIAATGAVNRSVHIDTVTGASGYGVGVERIGSYIFLFYQFMTSANKSNLLYAVVNQSTFAVVSSGSVLGSTTAGGAIDSRSFYEFSKSSGPYWPVAVSSDGTSLYVASWFTSGATPYTPTHLVVSKYTVSGTSLTFSSTTAMATLPTDFGSNLTTNNTTEAGFGFTARDGAVDIALYGNSAAGVWFTRYSFAGVENTSARWYSGSGVFQDPVANPPLLMYNGSLAYVDNEIDAFVTLSNMIWDSSTNLQTLWAGVTWYDSSGVYESQCSPVAGISQASHYSNYPQKRQTVVVTSPVNPYPSPATDMHVYGLVSSSTKPASTSLGAQTGANVSATTSSPVTWLAYQTGGSAPPVTNNFPGATSKVVAGTQALTAPWSLGGDGSILLPRTTSQPGTTKAQFWFDENGEVPAFTGANSRSKRLVARDAWGRGDFAGVRAALWAQFGPPQGVGDAILAENFDPSKINGSNALASGDFRGGTVYWPGGVTAGMRFLVQTPGNFTDNGSVCDLWQFDGSGNLTQVNAAQFKTSITTQLKTSGERFQAWAGGSTTLAAGVYVVVIYYKQSAVTTNPALYGFVAPSTLIWASEAFNVFIPQNTWLMSFLNGSYPASPLAKASLSLTPANTPWVAMS